ncbi:hypothetical protein A3Q34_04920 [Colwellia sp. PAMC 20917]|uniref:DUF4433 domain-containing protein n=1 Tax=Colwellia sp. PAMC 20917 TaxID=1816218 RepID=UPI0008787C1A|nr:DUF4433 domain-containing protein [Colwellia sp. PAMC 20917]AOW76257.1 hypothetical protein A3Q34_04920 [Colwellia sp. PAMC 20917]
MAYNFSDVTTVDHMTHIGNLEGILANGLLAHNNPHKKVDISNQEVNARRSALEPIYKKSMHDYVPFYFNPKNAMLYRNQCHFKKGGIVVLGFNKNIIATPGAVYTNGNASRKDTCFSNDKKFLEQINWDYVFSPRWNYQGNSYEAIKTAMMSELLVHGKVSIDKLEIIFCETEQTKQYIINNLKVDGIRVEVCSHMFF